MKQLVILALLAGTCLFPFSRSLYATDREIVLAYSDIESFPYQMANSSKVASPPGLALDIISQAAQDIGVRVKFVRYPNKRVQAYLKSGKIDGAFIFCYQRERLDMGVYPMNGSKLDKMTRIASISYYLYKQKNDSLQWDGKRITALKGSIGANAGYSIVGDIQKMGINVTEAKNINQLAMMTRLNRISGFAAQDITTDPYLASEGFSDIEKIEIPLKTKDYFLLFSHQFVKKYPEIAEDLWKRIGEIRESKTEEAIERYIN